MNAIDVDCPYCGAWPGYACTIPSLIGCTLTHNFHPSRIALSKELTIA